MASEYYKWLARDVKPAEKRVLTKAERRRNWWYYHKYHVLIGFILVSICGSILCSALGIGQVKPDYAIAYVGTFSLTEDDVSAIEAVFAAHGRDENGDGVIHTAVNQYVSHSTGDSDSLYYAQAAAAQLIADITDCDSYFFLLEDPEAFQQQFHALRALDGSLPEDQDPSAEGKFITVRDCAALAELPEGLQSLAFGRRGFWDHKTTDHAEGCDLLWAALTEGSN